MGYYTSYELFVDKRGDEINEYVIKDTEGPFHNYALEYEGEGTNHWYPYDSVKWYSNEEDMLALSTQFPDVLFTLDGDGEDSGDIWRKWFKNGMVLDYWYLNYDKPEYPEGYTP